MTLRGSRVRILRNHLHHRFHQRRVLLRREKHGPHESPRSLNAGLEVLWLVGRSGAGQDMAPELVWIEHAVVGFGGGAAGKLGLTGAAHVRTALLWPADCAASTGLAASSDIDGIY